MDTDYLKRFAGVGRLYGERSLIKFSGSHLAIVGLGGVGSWVAEALARSGVGWLTLMDLDEICISNTNRQLHTLTSTYTKSKAETLKKRLQEINPELKVNIIDNFFTQQTIETFFIANYDYVFDCIDGVSNKCVLISECRKRSLPIITIGAAGGKRDPMQIKIADLGKSFNDGLMLRVKKKLRREFGFPSGKGKLGVASVFSPEEPIVPEASAGVCKLDCGEGLGSTTAITGSFGFFAVAHVLKELSTGP